MGENYAIYSPYYPDDISGPAICIMEGCNGPICTNCYKTNYRWLGFNGAMTKLAKKWGCTRDEAEARWIEEQERKFQEKHQGKECSDEGCVCHPARDCEV